MLEEEELYKRYNEPTRTWRDCWRCNKRNIYLAIDIQLVEYQASLIQARDKFHGKPFTFLIDIRSMHSFTSPTMIAYYKLHIKKLQDPYKWKVVLRNGPVEQLMDVR